MNTTITKGEGIESLVSRYIPRVENTADIHISDNGLDPVFNLYDSLLSDGMFTIVFNNRLKSFTEILTPFQINSFIQVSEAYEDKMMSSITGIVTSRLLQLSYNAGNNNFTLHSPAAIYRLCCKLRGTEHTPFRVKVIGDVGRYFGANTYRVELSVAGSSQDGLGSEAQHSTFTINGNITGKVGYDAWHSTLKTSNEINLKRLMRKAPKQNRIVFIHPDGTEEIMRNAKH